MTELLTEAREVLSRCRTSGVVDLGTWARAHLADLLDELEAQRARVDELAAQRDPADEVLVEGSWFHLADLPKVLGNFMRAASDYAAEAKDMYVRLEKLRADRAEELAAIAAKQQRDAARIEELKANRKLLGYTVIGKADNEVIGKADNELRANVSWVVWERSADAVAHLGDVSEASGYAEDRLIVAELRELPR